MNRLHLFLSMYFIWLAQMNVTVAQSLGPNIQIHPNQRVQQFEMSVAVHPSDPNTVLATWNSIDTAKSVNRVGWGYTTDGGISWAGGDTLLSNPDAGNQPMVDHTAVIGSNGDLFVSGFFKAPPNREVFVARSTNNGINWVQTTMANSDDADKVHTIIDVNSGSPYEGSIYSAYSPNGAGSPWPIRYLRSTDIGVSFSTPVAISGSVTGTAYAFGANLALGSDNTLYATWGGFGSNIVNTQSVILGFNKSTDGGITWTGASQIGTLANIGSLSKGGNTVRAPSLPSMAVDRSGGPRGGWIYITYAGRNPSDPDILMIRSTDGGTTWSSPIKVNQDNSGRDQWHAWMSVDPSTGYLYVIYYDSRNFAGNDSAQVYVSSSKNGGDTFTDYLVSDVAFLPKGVRHLQPALDNTYMGSYIGISAAQGTVWACWNDNRTGFHQAYLAKIPDTVLVSAPRLIESSVPSSYDLEQNYPNPFNPSTNIGFKLQSSGFTMLTIYDLQGRQVAMLVNERLGPGTYEVSWDASGFPSGMYFYRLQARQTDGGQVGEFVETRKLLLLR